VTVNEKVKSRKRTAGGQDSHSAIQDAFNECGVQIMSPHFICSAESPDIVPRAPNHSPDSQNTGNSAVAEDGTRNK
jgi:hypothetical protein